MKREWMMLMLLTTNEGDRAEVISRCRHVTVWSVYLSVCVWYNVCVMFWWCSVQDASGDDVTTPMINTGGESYSNGPWNRPQVAAPVSDASPTEHGTLTGLLRRWRWLLSIVVSAWWVQWSASVECWWCHFDVLLLGVSGVRTRRGFLGEGLGLRLLVEDAFFRTKIMAECYSRYLSSLLCQLFGE